jgi:hypothetical protein
MSYFEEKKCTYEALLLEFEEWLKLNIKIIVIN